MDRRAGSERWGCRARLVLFAAALAGLACGAETPGKRADAAAASPDPARKRVPGADGARAYALVESLCAFGPRTPGGPGHGRALAFLESRLRGATRDVRSDAFPIPADGGGTIRATNLLARFRPELTDRVIVGAHWDTRPRADRDPDPARRADPIVGANDGASGTALLLLLADAMSASPPPVGVDLVLFDAEDWGREGDLANYCLGARRFAATLPAGQIPRAGLIVDMVGDADLAIRKEGFSRGAAGTLVETIWRIAGEVGAESFLDENAITIFDDHVPLIQAGVPAALLIDLEYDAWHTHADLPDRVSAASLGQVARVLLAWIYAGAPVD